MNLGLYVEKLSARRPPPPAYSPNSPETLEDTDPNLQNATQAAVLHQPLTVPKLVINLSERTPPAVSQSDRHSLYPTRHEGVALSHFTERSQHRKTTSSLIWGPQYVSSRMSPSSIPKSLVVISKPNQSPRSVIRAGPGFQRKPDDDELNARPRPVMKLPRSNSVQLRRKMGALIDPKLLFDQVPSAPRRRYRVIVPDPSFRDEVESLSMWLKEKLERPTDKEFIVQVVATAIDDLIRQVGQQMAERGILLADLIDRDRQSRLAIASHHEQQAVEDVKNIYRERIVALIESQRSELERYNDERLEIWNECEQLRKHIMERDEMMSDLQHQMDENVTKRDDIIRRQEQTAFQLQCALDDLSVRLNDSQQQLTAMKTSLNQANAVIADLRLDLQFAAERGSLTLDKRLERPGAPVSANNTNMQPVGEKDFSAEGRRIGSELAHQAATRIQSLVRGRKARRHASDLGNITSIVNELNQLSPVPNMPNDDCQHLEAVPKNLRRLFQCSFEVYHTYFQQEIPLQKFLRWLHNIVLAKSDYDMYAAQTAIPPLSFAEMVYDYYLSQHNQRESVELDLIDLSHNLSVYRPESARVRLFSKFLSEEASRITDAAFIVHEGLRLYACGPFENAVDNSEGVCWIDVPGALDILKRMFGHFPEEDLNTAMQKIQARSKTLGMARQFTGASRTAYKGIDKFMDLDDCLEIVWDMLKGEDQRLTATLATSFSHLFAKNRIDSDDVAPTLSDFEVMLRVVDQSAAESALRVLHIYRNAGKIALKRKITINDLVTASRNAGISPIKISTEDFPRLTVSRIQRLRTETDDEFALSPEMQKTGPMVVYQRADLTDEHVAMLQRRLTAMREKVIDTANTWKAKLERMQEKYDGLSSKLRAEYETRLADLLTQERDQADERLNLVKDQHRAKLQLCFEKFEEHRGASDVMVDDLRAKLRLTQNELRRLASESANEKQQLYEAVENLSARLENEVAKSRIVADDLTQHTQRLVEDLGQGTALMAQELETTTRQMERSHMGEEDCRARLLAQAVRQASESNMLRRGKLIRNESLRPDLGLVATMPPITSLDFDRSVPSVTRQNTLTAGNETIQSTTSRKTSRQSSLKIDEEFQFI